MAEMKTIMQAITHAAIESTRAVRTMKEQQTWQTQVLKRMQWALDPKQVDHN